MNRAIATIAPLLIATQVVAKDGAPPPQPASTPPASAASTAPSQGLDPTIDIQRIVVRPSMSEVSLAFSKSKRRRIKTVIVAQFDADGRIGAASLEPPTGNTAIDDALVKWALAVRLQPGAPGIGRIPIELTK